VSLRADSSTCLKVLASLALVIADEFDRPVIEVFGGQVVLTSPSASAAMRLTAVYDVRDLLTDGHSTDRLGEAASPAPTGDKAAAMGDGGEKPRETNPAPAKPGAPGAANGGDRSRHENPAAAPVEQGADDGKPPTAPLSAAERFSSLLMDHVDPEAWENFGGSRAQLSERDGVLIVSAPASIHRRLREMLSQLRAANPTALIVEALIIDLPQPELTRLSRLHDGAGSALAQTIRAVPEAVVVWQTREIVGIDATLAVESRAAETVIHLSLKAGFDRDRGLIRIDIDASTVMGPDQRALRTTASISVQQQGGVFELPPAQGGGAANSTTRVLLLSVRPTA
jgi:hypothetical protein